jgi:DNA-binding XRE family transcriptional regulator
VKKNKKNQKNQQNQQKGAKKLAIHRETLHALEEGKLEVVAGGASRCPTACSVC